MEMCIRDRLKASQDEVEGLKNEAAHQLDAARQKRDELIQQGENELEAARAKARALAQEVESKAYALTDELRQIQKDERMSTCLLYTSRICHCIRRKDGARDLLFQAGLRGQRVEQIIGR